jgi:hypothetical protein
MLHNTKEFHGGCSCTQLMAYFHSFDTDKVSSQCKKRVAFLAPSNANAHFSKQCRTQQQRNTKEFVVVFDKVFSFQQIPSHLKSIFSATYEIKV